MNNHTDTVTAEDAEEITQYLIEVGGGMKVDPRTGEIRREKDDTPFQVETVDGPKCILAYREVLKIDDHVVLNLFNDDDNDSAHIIWFYQNKSRTFSSLVSVLMELAYLHDTKAKDKNYPLLELAAIVKKGTKDFIKDLFKIDVDDMLRIFYKRNKKTCQVQTNLFDENFATGSDISQKNLDVIQKCFLHIFKCDSYEEFTSEFKFTSAMHNVARAESHFRVIKKLLGKIEKYSVAVGEPPFELDVIERHMGNLHKYAALTSWIATPAIPVSQGDSSGSGKVKVSTGVAVQPKDKFGPGSKAGNMSTQKVRVTGTGTIPVSGGGLRPKFGPGSDPSKVQQGYGAPQRVQVRSPFGF